MSRLSFFQKYSGKENHLTNNTLLLFRHIYQKRPSYFFKFMAELYEVEEEYFECLFQQQTKLVESIIDGHIKQRGFEFFIETKLETNKEQEQAINHLNAFENKKNTCFYVFLSKTYPDTNFKKKIENYVAQLNYEDQELIKISYLRFSDLVDNLSKILTDYDEELRDVLDDYSTYLTEHKHLDDRYKWLAGVICTDSLIFNMELDIYHEPQSYPPTKYNAKYIGFYKNKTIHKIGEIEFVVEVDPAQNFEEVKKNMKLLSFSDKQELDEENFERLRKVIFENKIYKNIKNEHIRVFLLKKNAKEINFKKESDGGMRGLFYINLEEYINDISDQTSIKEIASTLDGQIFSKKKSKALL